VLAYIAFLSYDARCIHSSITKDGVALIVIKLFNIIYVITLPPIGLQSIVISMSICLSVCCHVSKPTCLNLRNFLCMLTLAVAWSFFDITDVIHKTRST